jgi:hypothetical protein
MANEPERPIEKLLRDAVKKRRDEASAPMELHPATRRLLQGEVARTFAKPGRARRSASEVLGQLWPRFAWGVASFAVLVVVGYMLLPVPGTGKPEALLARNEPMTQAVPAKQSLPPPPAAVATVPASPAPAVGSKPSEVAFADTTPPAPARAARQLGAERKPLAKDSLAAPVDREAKEQPAPATALGLADRSKAFGTDTAASGGQPAQAPAGVVNGAYQRQSGFAGKPAPAPSAPAAPAALPPVATTVAAASAASADESKNLTADKSEQLSFAYKSPAAVASANRHQSSPAAMDSLLKSVAESRMATGSASAGQWFAQVAPGAKAKKSQADKAAPAHPVLASFQVQQAGRELWIVDSDGSVYSGYLQIADAARRQRLTTPDAPAAGLASRASEGALDEKAAVSGDADQQTMQTYSFRVAGTNRSLSKKVVFTGNLLAATNLTLPLPFGTNFSIGGGLGGSQNLPAQQGRLLLLNSRISGKVVIGNGKAVEVHALPTSP